MATGVDQQEYVDDFEQFLREYYRDEVGELARNYPSEQKSLYVDWDDLFRFDRELAEQYVEQPEQLQRCAEEALRLYDLPIDVSLGQAHVRIHNLPDATDIREIRARHVNTLVAVKGIVRKATDVRPKCREAAFRCLRCESLNRVPQEGGRFQEPHECRSCERQGPFRLNEDQSEFVDAQRIRIQESPEGLRGGETPQAIDVDIEDDVTGEVTPGDHVTATGILRLDQDGEGDSPIFDVHMEGIAVQLDEEEFEDMDITDEDKEDILELAGRDDVYERMIGSIAPSIHGYDEEKLAMTLQLFSGVTKHLPDDSRIRGDLHMLLIGDPGTGKCVAGDTTVTLADGTDVPIRQLVESNLDDPTPVDDGVYDDVAFDLPSMGPDGNLELRSATRVWKREAPERLYRIRTATGREIDVTPSHPLFVQRGGSVAAVRAADLDEGTAVATAPTVAADGGVCSDTGHGENGAAVRTAASVSWDRITSIEQVPPADDWVYDLEVEDTHTYLSNGIVSHNSQLLQYVRNIAPRSVYTSGKGSSSAGLTAAAVRDDFGDGQQWTLEAGALVLADQGVAAVDELDKMRCVTGDSLVHLADGRVERIGELARTAAKSGEIEHHENGRTVRDVDCSVWTMTENGRLVRRPVTAIHEYDAPDDLTRVTLESGERLTSTRDHPYFVLDHGERVERPAEELDSGDWVYVPRQVPSPVSDGGAASVSGDAHLPETESSALGAVLGYLSGDGNVYYDREEGVYGIRFTNSEPELLADFERSCRLAFGAEPYRAESERRDDGVQTVRLSGREYADAVLDAGMGLGTYDRKPFPTGVSGAGRDTKAAFVRALADSEGTVDTQTGNVRIFSASRDLLVGTKELLLEFDVSSQIQRRPREGKRDLFVLAITDAASLEAYARHVGFQLDRKQSALEVVCEAADGDRTILDVVPDIDPLLEELRGSLRLYQSECGIAAGTYCAFENGDANVSIHRAERILEAFDGRVERAVSDRDRLEDRLSWSELSEIKERYHVSQSELAEGTDYSQQQISKCWGRDTELRGVVQRRLGTILAEVAATSLDNFRSLVESDVKWRRVESVETIASAPSDRRLQVIRNELADHLSVEADEAVAVARDRLAEAPEPQTWQSLRETLDRYEFSFQTLAADLGVAGSTVSRWFSGAVDTDRFAEVRDAALERIAESQSETDRLLTKLESYKENRVYDLSVERTQNFLSNGIVVHNSEDRSAMHEALEQQSISISKAGINATLKSRCSLLGAANPKYGRFDQYEPMGEQIDLEPALISRFDLIFTVTDQPDPEKDRELAEHILESNYAGQLNTQRQEMSAPDVSAEQVSAAQEEVQPTVGPELLRKYVAYAQQHCYPRLTDEARAAIEDFYVDLRSKGADEDAPVPVTARKLEALVRLAEASARVRLSDQVEREDAERVIEIVRSSLQDIGVDPETGQFDADVVETGTSKSQRDRIKNLKGLIDEMGEEYEEGVPVDALLDRAEEVGIGADKAESELEKLKQKGEVYEPRTGHVRTT